MKICLLCHAEFKSLDWRCPACGKEPAMFEGFPTFVPEQAAIRSEYKIEHYDALAELEEKNFWFLARNKLLVWAINQYFPKANNYCEVGCGTGFVLAGFNRAFPEMQLSGSEIFVEGLRYATKRVNTAKLFQMDARNIPFSNEFDVIGAFDVLEHIEDDTKVLSQFYQATRPKGGVILTVPQHDFLWSYQDEAACHVRRYSATELKRKVINAGFEVVKITSFVSLLLPLMMVSRFMKRSPPKGVYDPQSELRLGWIANSILKGVMEIEFGVIRAGANLPAGGSLLLIAQKR